MIPDRLWRPIAPLLPGKATDRGVTARDNRLFSKLFCGRCAPAPPGQTCHLASGTGTVSSAGCRWWAGSGVFQRMFASLRGDPDLEYVLIDGTIVPVHQQAAGAKGHAAPVHWPLPRRADNRRGAGGRGGQAGALLLLPGQRHESKGAATAQQPPFGALLADKAFDSDGLLRELQARGATAVIPATANRKQRRAYDRQACKRRHPMGNFFAGQGVPRRHPL